MPEKCFWDGRETAEADERGEPVIYVTDCRQNARWVSIGNRLRIESCAQHVAAAVKVCGGKATVWRA